PAAALSALEVHGLDGRRCNVILPLAHAVRFSDECRAVAWLGDNDLVRRARAVERVARTERAPGPALGERPDPADAGEQRQPVVQFAIPRPALDAVKPRRLNYW